MSHKKGTCEWKIVFDEDPYGTTVWYMPTSHYQFADETDCLFTRPTYCPVCGKRVIIKGENYERHSVPKSRP